MGYHLEKALPLKISNSLIILPFPTLLPSFLASVCPEGWIPVLEWTLYPVSQEKTSMEVSI